MAATLGRSETGRTLALISLVVAAVGLGTALYSLTYLAPGSHVASGTQGPPGPPGPPGSSGENGSNGSGGGARSWATFSPTILLFENVSNITLASTPCYYVGSGLYDCNVSFNNSSPLDAEFQGLNFTPSTGFYFVGSNPTWDALMDENVTTTFQLWFQVTASEGTLQPVIYLHLGELYRS